MDTATTGQRRYPCPDCGVESDVDGCRHCGRGLSALLAALSELDGQLTVTVEESRRLRIRMAAVDEELESLRRRRGAVAAELTAKRHAAMARQAAAAPRLEPVPEAVEEPTPVAAAEPEPTVPLATATVEPSDTRTPEASTRSVQNVLLLLGGILSAAAIIVFTAVAWATFGAPGRAGILTVITVALMLAPLWIIRKGLHATAETVSGLAILMLPCDAVALYLLRLFPTTATEPIATEPATREFGGTLTVALTTGVHTPGIAIGLVTITGIAVAYRMFTRMIVPGFAVTALGLATLAVGLVQASTVLGTGLLLVAAALQGLAAGLFGGHPARRGRIAGRILVHCCGGLAVVLLLAATEIAVGSGAPGYRLLAAAVVTAVVLAVVGRLPTRWRIGPLWTARVALTIAALFAIGAGLVVVFQWLLLPLPPWHATLSVPGWPTNEGYPFGWRLTVAIIVLTVAAAAQLPHRERSPRNETTTSDRLTPIWPNTVSTATTAAHPATDRPDRPKAAPTQRDPFWDATAQPAGPAAVGERPPHATGPTTSAVGRTAWTDGHTEATTASPLAGGRPGTAGPDTSADGHADATTAQHASPASANPAERPGHSGGPHDPPPTSAGLPRWRARQVMLALLGGVFAALTLPAALGLSWRAGALLVLALAAATVLASVATTDRRLSTALLVAAAPVALFAIALSVGGSGTMFTVLAALCGWLAVFAVAAGRRGRLAHAGGMTGAAVWALSGVIPVAWHLLGMAPVHLAALTATLAAGLALVAGYPVTRRATPRQRRFTSWVSLGTVGGMVTAAVTAAVLAVAVGGTPLSLTTALLGLLLVTVTAAMLLSRVRLRPRPTDPQAASPGQLRRQVTGLATIALLLALGTHVSLLTPSDTLPGFVILALVAAIIAKLVPRRLGSGPAWGSWTVAGVTAAFYAGGTIAAVPALFTAMRPFPWLNWRGPVVLAVLALAALALLPKRWRIGVAVGFATLSLLGAPAIWPLPWWLAPVLYVAVAVGYAAWALAAPPRTATTTDDHTQIAQWTRGLLGYGFAALGLSVAALGLRVPDPAAGYRLAAALTGALVIACAVIAVLGYRRHRALGGVAVATGLILLPGAVTLAGLSLLLPAEPIRLGAMAAACLGLLVAACLRLGARGYLPWATLVVPLVAVTCAQAGLPSQQSGMYVAVAGLIGVGAAMLMLPDRRAALLRTVLSSLAIVVTLVKVLPLPLLTLALPYQWLGVGWGGGVWNGTTLTTMAGLTPDGEVPQLVLSATRTDLAILTVGVTTIALAVLGLAGRGWGIGAGLAALALALPTVPVVFDLPWPTLPFTTLAIAATAYLVSTHVRLPRPQLSILGVVAAICCGTAMTGALASRPTTLTALTVFAVATLTGGLLGASTPRRVIGWLLSGATVTGLITASALAAKLPPQYLPYGIVAVAALFVALASARTPLTGPATWAAEAAGHLAALTAVVAAIAVAAATPATVSTVAIVLVIYGALLGLLAVRADSGEDTVRLLASKPWYTTVSIAAAFAAYWLLLADARVAVIEVYTVPFALATLLGGWLELRRRPRLRSWTAYGPGLCLLLLPPLAQILLTEAEPLRRLGLGVASIAILLLGSRQRFQAPVVVATIMLIVQTGYEITLLWTLVPSWLPLAIGGVGLLVLGATFERRRRDVRRLRGALAEMR